LAMLRGLSSGVSSVALSMDPRSASSAGQGGQLLASGGVDGTVRLWEGPFASLEPGAQHAKQRAESRDSAPASFRTEGTGPPSLGRLPAALHGHSGLVFGVALSTDGRVVASGSVDG